MDYLVLGLAALFAGMIDAIVGGGGLIQIPVLFSTFPSVAPATLLGTSKLGGVWGTATAAINLARRVRVRWATAVPAALAAFVFSFLGAVTVAHVAPDALRRALPFILVAVAAYTFMRKDFGRIHAPAYIGTREMAFAAIAGSVIGFYDGFFGPGTGSFLVFVFVRFFGFDFLGASAVAKVVNVACNVAALLWFGYSGHLLWKVGAILAVCNVAGSILGTRLAIKHGSGFVRQAFLAVVCVLILKTTYDAFLR